MYGADHRRRLIRLAGFDDSPPCAYFVTIVAQGCFTPESVWTVWKAWKFGQKKEPSWGLTLAAWRVMSRAGNHRAWTV
ncbi:MAG: hypothetical protein GYA20_06715 [Chloroflexi bacterium]|nr:hypothetical protein [Chloroflexota bacterium]